jgi:hypothetical protein
MNQVTTVDPLTNLKLAEAFAGATLVPEVFRKSVGNCLIAIDLANRYGMNSWSLMQEMYIINGRPMMSGKLAIAILNNSLAEPLRPEYSSEGDDRTITLTGRLQNEAAAQSVKLKVRDARTANEQWKKNPDQMLMYASARTWGRRFAPDILLGIVFDDEEIPGVTAPASPPAALAPAPGLKPQAPPPHDPETGEIKPPHEIEVLFDANDQPETFVEWGKRFLDYVKTSDTVAQMAAWNELNADKLVEIKEAAPKVYTRLDAAINAHRIRLEAT